MPRRAPALLVLLLAAFPASASRAQSFGTEYVTFARGDLRIFATSSNTRVELIDLDTGALATGLGTNPRVLAATYDSWEISTGPVQRHLRVRASDASGAGEPKPVVVWTGQLHPSLVHPASPPPPPPGLPDELRFNPWMSYLPALRESSAGAGAEVGRDFIGFTSRELWLIARKGAAPTLCTIQDEVTNTDADGDDDHVLTAASPELQYADAEIEAWFVDGFEDDTIRVTCNVDASVLVGYNGGGERDWTATPPSYAAGDEGSELGTLFYAWVQSGLSVFPTQDDTLVEITDLSDLGVLGQDDSTTVLLADGDPSGPNFDFWTVVTSNLNSPIVIPRSGPAPAPVVTVHTNEPDPFEGDLVKVVADKPVLLYTGPSGSNVREFADVAFSVPTGTLERLTYAYAQNGGAEDLQVFAFDPATQVRITSLTTSIPFMGLPVFHDFDIPLSEPWLGHPSSSDRYWQSGIWRGELLRIQSDRPITVINGDYDSPNFGAFIPFVRTVPLLPPVAVAEAEPAEGCNGEAVTLRGDASFDQDDEGAPPQIVSCAWDFSISVDTNGNFIPDDDVDSTDCVTTTVPRDCEQTIARLTVTDNEGETDTDDVLFSRGVAEPPTVDCPGPLVVECGPDVETQYEDWLDSFDCDGDCGLTERIQAGFTFEDFSDLSDFQLNGVTAPINATPVLSGGAAVLRLTDSLSQAGSAFLTDPVSLAADASFSTSFEFQIGDPEGASDPDGQGADGIVFVLQTVSNTAGGFGFGIGYGGLPNSVGIEFDTWNNGAFDDFDGNHVGIDVNGSVDSLTQLAVSPRMNDGAIWTAWVDYDGAIDLLEVRLRRGEGAARPAAADLATTLDLPAVLGSSTAFMGFTSGTGAAGGDHDIRRWSLRTSFDPVGCSGTGDRTVQYACTDDCGNEASCTRVFTVQDTTPPVLVTGSIPACHATLAEAEAAALAATGATDACDPAPELTVTGSLAGCEATLVVTATDQCGNPATTSYLTTVDGEPPTILPPMPLVLECDDPAGVPVSDPRVQRWLEAASATDACGPVTVENDLAGTLLPGCAPGVTRTVSFSSVDACGNAVSITSTITVVDTTPPELSVPAPIVLECSSPGGVPLDDPRVQAWLAAASAADACGNAVVAHDAPALLPSGCAPDGAVTPVSFTATDDCGLTTVLSSTVTVVDTTPPEVLSGDERLACLWPPNHRLVCFETADFEELVGPRISDLCDSGPLTWRFAGCLSEQPDEARDPSAPGWNGDGRTEGDCAIAPDGSGICFRSERAGTGPGDHGEDGASAQEGRRYSVLVVATDACGNESEPVPVGHVLVPHDQSPAEDDCVNAAREGRHPRAGLPF